MLEVGVSRVGELGPCHGGFLLPVVDFGRFCCPGEVGASLTFREAFPERDASAFKGEVGGSGGSGPDAAVDGGCCVWSML